LNHLAKACKSITCPFCHKSTSFSSYLPINFALRDIVEANLAKIPEPSEALCELHEKAHPATHWCTECEQGLCDEAKQLHLKFRGSAMHQVCSIDEPVRKQETPALCSIHKREAELVCKQDNEAICVICVATKHHGHPCQTPGEWYHSQEKAINLLVGQAKDKSKSLQQMIEQCSNSKDELLHRQEEIRRAVTEYFEIIAQKKASVLASLDYQVAEVVKSLKNHEDGLDSSNESIMHAQQLLLEAFHGNTNIAKAITVMGQLEAQVQMKQANCPAIPKMEFVKSLDFLTQVTIQTTMEPQQASGPFKFFFK